MLLYSFVYIIICTYAYLKATKVDVYRTKVTQVYVYSTTKVTQVDVYRTTKITIMYTPP
uniref:Uncharacterized protein n=1 Tax=Arion vulgaris TaxID=1028688 RepID=A0A0B7ARL4_9EUPU